MDFMKNGSLLEIKGLRVSAGEKYFAGSIFQSDAMRRTC